VQKKKTQCVIWGRSNVWILKEMVLRLPTDSRVLNIRGKKEKRVVLRHRWYSLLSFIKQYAQRYQQSGSLLSKTTDTALEGGFGRILEPGKKFHYIPVSFQVFIFCVDFNACLYPRHKKQKGMELVFRRCPLPCASYDVAVSTANTVHFFLCYGRVHFQ
jgi:hypothetical protein